MVVVRIGDGSAALTSAATATFLLEYTPAGVLVQTIALPTVATGTNSILTNTGSSTSDAVLTRSVNGAYLVLTGYDAAVGTLALTTTASATNNRIIGRVAANGTVDTSTRIGDAFSGTSASGANIRSAASVDGTSFYAVGSNTGVRYVPFGTTAATATTALATAAPTNNRAVGIYGGNLYVASASGANFGISQVGTGLTTAGPQTITQLPGFPTATGPSPYAFYFADLSTAVAGVDVVYIADDRAAPDGGIQKWSLVSGTWTLNGTIVSSATTSPALRGVNGQTTGTTVSLVASGNGGLYILSDNAGYNAVPSTIALPAAIATAGTNAAFRGVAFAPVSVGTATLASQALPGLELFPNPATDRITVALPTAGAATVALRDLAGRLVLAPAALAANQQVRFPAGLAAGVYLLEVRQGSVTAVRRVEKN
ncbi:T9SS type A sorting domain-containing protein [Hymenobacter terricola]|uniref:T9SS type A sorting domain-containing protein n=1 Tax=Hymenobacter terricola TaxID=2819236 RepID=UPI001B30E839|nr:T9SS type A sorting domain-containing protein [Hymenobacter terricola]